MDVRWEEHGWERLAPGVGRRRLPGWDATVGLVCGEGGALLYDTGSSPAEGVELAVPVRALLGGRRVTHVALSHPHFDHVLGTVAFPGAAVYGAAGMAELLAGAGAEELCAEAVREGVPEAAARAAVARLVLPGHEVGAGDGEEVTVDLGGGQRVVLVNAGPGHTAHDLAALVPGAGPVASGARPGLPGASPVVFCGDLVEESGAPQAGRDAVPEAWPAALDRLLALGGEGAVYVPGHGAVVDAAFVRAQRAALAEQFGGSGAPS
ncbi:MBL fold metallo-hydrolase [Streptomyces sp. NPDC093085]|uniref:MBL fold metallo-hydrolase n=1 Tax=Streptomyces sp. NPDC093085 TaxID=3155068 RepID=UPI0034387C2F